MQLVVGGLVPGPEVIVILQSDVELRARIALLRAAGPDAAFGPLPTSLLRAAQQEVLGEALIAFEAGRLALTVPTRAEQQRERERLLSGAGERSVAREVFERLGVTSLELDTMAQRRLTVSEFLEANLVGAGELSEAALRRAYDAEEHPYHDRPFEEVREALRALLTQRAVEQAVARWVEGLKQRVPHRVLVAY